MRRDVSYGASPAAAIDRQDAGPELRKAGADASWSGGSGHRSGRVRRVAAVSDRISAELPTHGAGAEDPGLGRSQLAWCVGRSPAACDRSRRLPPEQVAAPTRPSERDVGEKRPRAFYLRWSRASPDASSPDRL